MNNNYYRTPHPKYREQNYSVSPMQRSMEREQCKNMDEYPEVNYG